MSDDGASARFVSTGTIGVNLAVAYEVRATIASAAGDATGFEHFASLCRLQVLRGSRLVQRLKRRDVSVRRGDTAVDVSTEREAAFISKFSAEMSSCTRPRERARRAIELMTQFSGASGGLLYLRREEGIGLAALAGDIAPTDIAPAALTRYFETECGNGSTAHLTAGRTLSKRLRHPERPQPTIGNTYRSS
jgi:hypothetical protein